MPPGPSRPRPGPGKGYALTPFAEAAVPTDRRLKATWSTWLFAAFSLVSIAVISVMTNTAVFAESLRVAVSDVGSALVISQSGLVALQAALSLPRRMPSRRQWLLIAAAILLTGAGDCAWTYGEVVLGVEPYVGFADVAYLAAYPFLAWGLVSAALTHRGSADVRRALAVTGVSAGAGIAAVTFGLLLPFILPDPGVTPTVKVLSSFYPLADIALAAAPALFVVLVLWRFASGAAVRPWLAATAGTIMLAASDAAFSWQDWAGAYVAGGAVDIGWMLAFTLMGLGACLARDLAQS